MTGLLDSGRLLSHQVLPLGPQTMFGLLNKVRPILPGHNNGSVASALARWGVAFGLIGFFMVREELPDPFAKTEKPTE